MLHIIIKFYLLFKTVGGFIHFTKFVALDISNSFLLRCRNGRNYLLPRRSPAAVKSQVPSVRGVKVVKKIFF